MAGNLLILKGSPREKGNSAVLADQVAAGAADGGWQVDSVSLQSLDIRACDACDLCKEADEVCVIDDDMQAIYPKLCAADALVLATPVYWFTFSAQLKLCIDRWYGLWVQEPGVFLDKPVGVVLTYGDTDLYNSGGINAIHTLDSIFRFLRAPIIGIVHGSLMDVGDAQQHPELMQAAYDLGKKIAQHECVTSAA